MRLDDLAAFKRGRQTIKVTEFDIANAKLPRERYPREGLSPISNAMQRVGFPPVEINRMTDIHTGYFDFDQSELMPNRIYYAPPEVIDFHRAWLDGGLVEPFSFVFDPTIEADPSYRFVDVVNKIGQVVGRAPEGLIAAGVTRDSDGRPIMTKRAYRGLGRHVRGLANV